MCGRIHWEGVVSRKCLQVEGARENRDAVGKGRWDKEVTVAEGLLSPPTWLACLTALCFLFSYPDHNEDLGHLPVDCPPGLQ